ncbi:MAG: ribosome biogenesis GTPase Der [Alphaproteobacteria bacterium]|jgi:GTP-binding protein|nr:ribosome biogenesis GTPase Der [Alphaproteobacteria bacterium]
MKQMFSVAIAGRPNVGKSTLFNRLIGKSMAIIDDQPGVTRDWRDGDGRLFDLRFKLYDTAGLEDRRPGGSISARMAKQTKMALGRSDVILMMVDGRTGLTDDDRFIAREVRKENKPIILLVNKCESTKLPEGYHEALALGFDKVIAISAQHGENMHEVYEALKPYAPEKAFAPDEEDEDLGEEGSPRLHIAIAGRPNAGKSTLANQYIGEERMLTGPEPGLTRDAIHINFDYKGQPVRLVDTAGMRRRARVDEALEKMSVKESLRAIRLAHVVILVLDAEMPFDKQDYTIAQHVAKEGRGLVIAVNKWDKVKDRQAVIRMIQAKVEASLAQLAGVRIIPISAKKGDGLDQLMDAVFKTYEKWNVRLSTGQLNRWFEGMVASHPPPIVGGGRVKPRYITQMKGRPPTFGMWGNKLGDLPESYLRFLTNGLRKGFNMQGVPIRWVLKKGENPYDPAKGK